MPLTVSDAAKRTVTSDGNGSEADIQKKSYLTALRC